MSLLGTLVLAKAGSRPGSKWHCWVHPYLQVGNFSNTNIGGVYIGDRTLHDPAKRFYPTPDNVIHIPALPDIFAQVSGPGGRAAGAGRGCFGQLRAFVGSTHSHTAGCWCWCSPEPALAISTAPQLEENDTEFEWALYSGQWGAPLMTPAWNLTCLFDERERPAAHPRQQPQPASSARCALKCTGGAGRIPGTASDR